jgi:hypothetical protein
MGCLAGTWRTNYDGIAPMTFRVSGDKLSGTTQSSTFKVKSKINGVSFSLPLPRVTAQQRTARCRPVGGQERWARLGARRDAAGPLALRRQWRSRAPRPAVELTARKVVCRGSSS